MPFDLSMGEVLLVLFVALLVFGGKLPEQARKIGGAIAEFKRGMREEMRKVEDDLRADDPPPEWRPPKSEPEGDPSAEPDPSDKPDPSAEPSRRDP